MPDRVDRRDVRILVGAVAQFAASFESRLRQIEPVLTLSQLVALERVAQHPRLRPFQLASQMKISRQLAWQTCKRLESLGLLSMSNMSAGKRGVEVEATQAGAAHLHEVAGLHAAIAEALDAHGDRLDLGALRNGLQKLTAAAVRLAPDGGEEAGQTDPDGPAAGDAAGHPGRDGDVSEPQTGRAAADDASGQGGTRARAAGHGAG